MNIDIDNKLLALGVELPEIATAVGSYVPAIRVGDLVYISGQLPFKDGDLICRGKVGGNVELAHAQEAAKIAVINALAAVKAEVGTLEAVTKIVRVEVFVNSADGFVDQAKVANGASDFLVELFGQNGRHTRIAIGVAELPLDAAVELAMIVQVK